VPALRGAGDPGQSARDLERACQGLEPFQALELGEFFAFLNRADEHRRSGTIRVPSPGDLDATTLLQAASRLDGASDVRSLTEAQAAVLQAMDAVAARAGLKLTVKPVAGWAEMSLARRRVVPHIQSIRALAARIDRPESYSDPFVRDAIASLTQRLGGDDLKALATEFGISATPKSKPEKVLTDVLTKLSGHRPGRATAGRKSPAIAADPVVINRHVQKLKELMERSNDPDLLPDSEVEAALVQLRALPKGALFDVANQAGIEGVYKSSTVDDILRRVRNRLTVVQRAQERAKV